MDNNKVFWERVANVYGTFMKSNTSLYNNISQKIKMHLKKDMVVLELACGSGQLTFPLAGYVKEWHATDFSSAMIRKAEKENKIDTVSFSVQDATTLPWGDGKYDAVLIANALHIMPRPKEALDEIFRVLKPGGLLFAPTFIWEDTFPVGLKIWLMQKIGFRVFHKWNEDAFVKFIAQRGFLVTDSIIMGSNLAPLCYLAAKKPFEEM
ncbi:class I SAM-dependent methyltransferase [Anaerotignum sp. MB30-C6]|uniref:class I SAM-dependent methyltransferase n=1 Tax=Anaerotignum sp. MB30-C6 TaxID=3070814 RepID=UPI0027DB2A18|nr:class I SAM-dependent methyltransferase [Anaerotignum sp. MB30-C6]WMI81098.1 class I SAM-dependent methyltransferase [Anaerotignum sp. MB30-C6]